jgi:hypothetical protein
MSYQSTCFLVALLCVAARSAVAQTAPKPDATAPASGRAESTRSLDRADAERNYDSDRPATTELTYQSDSAKSTGDRVLHYRLDTPREPSDADATDKTNLGSGNAAYAASDGQLGPYTLSPITRSGQSWVRAVAGYDSAAATFRARSAADSAVTSFFAVRVEFEHGPATGYEDRVAIGGRFQVFNQKKHGIDGGFGAFYRPRDFRGEGNFVGAVMLARHFGRLGLFGSALFGSDAEGDDQAMDGRVSMLYRVADHFEIGWDNHLLYVLSTDQKRYGTVTTDWELQLEPTAVVTLGPLAILTEAGFSALQTTGPIGELTSQRLIRTGMIAMAGAGGVL